MRYLGHSTWVMAAPAICLAASVAYAQLGGIGGGAGNIGGAAGNAVGGAANQVGQGIQQGVNRAGQAAQQGVNRAGQAAQQGVNRAGQATQQGINRAQRSAQGTVDRTQDRASRAVEGAQERTRRAVERANDGTNRALDRTEDRADRAFDDTSDRTDRAFDDTRDRTDRAFDDTRDRTDRAFDDTSDRIDRAFDDVRDRASRTTDRAGRALDRGLDRTGRSLDRAGDAIDRTGRNIRGRLDDAVRDTRGRFGERRMGRWGWSDLGIEFDARARNDLRIGSITSSSILGRAGLRRGDEIVSIDGREFSSQAAALNYLNRVGPNQTLDIVVLRNGDYVNLDASLAGLGTGIGGRTAARAYLGVTFDDQARDLRVFDIDRGSPAVRAGLRRGDQILSIDGREFDSYSDAVAYIQGRSPDDRLDLVVWRDGREIDLQANLAGFGQGTGRIASRTRSSFDVGPRAGLGVVFDERSSDQILISEVTEGSPAAIAGLRRGDVILSVDGRRMSSFDDVTRYIGQRSPREQVDIAVLRNGRRMNLQAELASRQQVFEEDESTPRERDIQRSPRFGDRFVEEGFDESERFPDRQRDAGLPGRVRESREAMRRRASETTERFDGQRGSTSRESSLDRERNRGQDSTYGEGETTPDRDRDPERGSDDN